MAAETVRDRGTHVCQFSGGSAIDARRLRKSFARYSLKLAAHISGTSGLVLLSACGSPSGSSSTPTGSAVASAAAISPIATQAIARIPLAVGSTPFNMGVNVNTADIWSNSRPFANLIYGTPAQMQNTSPWGGSEDIPPADLDVNGWVKALPAGYQVRRGLSVPALGGDIVCRFQGNGLLNVSSGPVSNVNKAAGITKFTIAPTNPADWHGVTLTYFVDPVNYIRNIDCREAGLPTTTTVAPEFRSALKGFGVVRFMKWSKVEANPAAIHWATRNKPGDGDYYQNDGVPVEVIIDTANQANADPWVTVPWNADDDYIRRYATYIRDNMAVGHRVNVETSNEVWNGAYPVFYQACSEAKSENLPGADGGAVGCAGERYAERTRQVMAIWSSVFSHQMSRLVRIFAWQHVSPYGSDKLLAYQNTFQYVDALATGPYFGHDTKDGQTVDQIFADLPGQVQSTIQFGVQQRVVAQKYKLRYLTYEGGQHIVLPSNVTLLQQIERDSRMGDVYSQYIRGWRAQVGDTLTLFALTGPISRYGAWGVLEYSGQPLADAPKMRAIASFFAPASSNPSLTSSPSTSKVPMLVSAPIR